MKHLEIVTDHDTHQLQYIMTNPFSEKGQLLLEILRIMGDSEVAEELARGDKRPASLRIRIEFKKGLVPGVTRPSEKFSRVLKVLQKVIARRKFDVELESGGTEGNWYDSNLTISEINSTEYFIKLFRKREPADDDAL